MKQYLDKVREFVRDFKAAIIRGWRRMRAIKMPEPTLLEVDLTRRLEAAVAWQKEHKNKWREDEYGSFKKAWEAGAAFERARCSEIVRIIAETRAAANERGLAYTIKEKIGTADQLMVDLVREVG